MHRWTAQFLLLVMLATALAPLALAGVDPPGVIPCCKRHRLREAAPRAANPAMPCHQGAIKRVGDVPARQDEAAADPSEVAVRSLDCCCGQHCNCGGSQKTSNWARLAPSQPSLVSLLIEPALAGPLATRVTIFSAGPASARAPPRS